MYKLYTYEDIVSAFGDECNIFLSNPNGELSRDSSYADISSAVAATFTITFASDPNYREGDKIILSGTAANDGIYTIATVAGGGSYTLEEPILDQGAGGISERVHGVTVSGHIYESISYGNYMVVLTSGNNVGFGNSVILSVIDSEGNIYSSTLVVTGYTTLSMIVLDGGYICVQIDSSISVFDLRSMKLSSHVIDPGFSLVGNFANLYIITDGIILRMADVNGSIIKELNYAFPGFKMIRSSDIGERWFINAVTSEIGRINKSLEIIQSFISPDPIVFAAEGIGGDLHVCTTASPVTVAVYDKELLLKKTISFAPALSTTGMGIDELGGVWVNSPTGFYRWKEREGLVEAVDGSLYSPPLVPVTIPGRFYGDIGTFPYNIIYNMSERIFSGVDSVSIISDGFVDKKVMSNGFAPGAVAKGMRGYFVATNKTGSFNTVDIHSDRFNFMKSIMFDDVHDIVEIYPVMERFLVFEYISTGGDLKLGMFDSFKESSNIINSIVLDGSLRRKIFVDFSGTAYIMEENVSVFKLRIVSMFNSKEDFADVVLLAPHDVLGSSLEYLPGTVIKSRDGAIYVVGGYIYNLAGASCDLGFFIKKYSGTLEISENVIQVGSISSSSAANTIGALTDVGSSIDAYDNIYFSMLLWNGNPGSIDPAAAILPVNCNLFPTGYLSSGLMNDINMYTDFDNRPVVESVGGDLYRAIKVFPGKETISPAPVASGIAVGLVDVDGTYRDWWLQSDVKTYRGGF